MILDQKSEVSCHMSCLGDSLPKVTLLGISKSNSNSTCHRNTCKFSFYNKTMCIKDQQGLFESGPCWIEAVVSNELGQVGERSSLWRAFTEKPGAADVIGPSVHVVLPGQPP